MATTVVAGGVAAEGDDQHGHYRWERFGRLLSEPPGPTPGDARDRPRPQGVSTRQIEMFANIARSLAEADTPEEVLTLIVDLAVRTVPGAQFAVVSMVHRRNKVETLVSTDDVCRRVDQVQYAIGEGPCLDAIWAEEIVGGDDLGGTDRWPRFCPRAVELGLRSMLVFRLLVEEQTVGALNLYSARPRAFTEESVELGYVLPRRPRLPGITRASSAGSATPWAAGT